MPLNKIKQMISGYDLAIVKCIQQYYSFGFLNDLWERREKGNAGSQFQEDVLTFELVRQIPIKLDTQLFG